MAQLEGKLDIKDSPDGHVKLSTDPDYQIGIDNGLEPLEEEVDGLTTPPPTPTPTYPSKNDENDVNNRLKQQTSEVQDRSNDIEEEYIVLNDEDSGLNFDNMTENVPNEVLKVLSGLDTFGTRDIFKKELKDSASPEPAGTNWTPSGSNLSGRDYGTVDRAPSRAKAASWEQDLPGSPECASVNGVTQFFDSIHALSIFVQDAEGETSLQSTSVDVDPAKNIQKQENKSAGTDLVYSHPSSTIDDLITTMEQPKNDEHKADDVKSETAPSGSSPISNKSTEKDVENVRLRDNAQEPHVPQQECSDMAQGQEEDFTGQPANVADDFASTVPEKRDMQTPIKLEQAIETPIEEDPVFSTIGEYFYDVGAPDNIQRSDVSQEAECRGQDELGRSDSDEVQFGPRPDNSVIPEETVKPIDEKPNSEESRSDEGAEIASRKQEELEAGEDEETQKYYDHQKSYTEKIDDTASPVEEKPNSEESRRGDEGAEIDSRKQEESEAGEDEERQKSYDDQKSYTEKIYETASTAAQAVASKLGYGTSEGQSDKIDGVNEGSDEAKKGIVERAGGVVASFLGLKLQEDGQQQESYHDMQEQTEADNVVETVEAQFWDAEADIVGTVEAQTQ